MLRICVFLLAVIGSLPASSQPTNESVKINDLLLDGFEIVAAHEFLKARVVYVQKETDAFQCLIEGDLQDIKEWFKVDESICTMFSPIQKISD